MTRNNFIRKILLFGLFFLLVSRQGAIGAEEQITVQAQVDRNEITAGESIMLEIKVNGDDSPAEPDLSNLQDFTVNPKGGGQNNRESITIINGRVNRVSEHGYIYRYELSPQKDGELTIPAIEVEAAGKTFLTRPITIRVGQPEVSDEFLLRLSLSEPESYVGQVLVLTIKWYVNRDIAEFTFDLPFLEDQRLRFAEYPEDGNYQGQDAITVNLAGDRVVARKGQEGQYTTVTLRQIVIPRQAGEFSLERGKVFSKILAGYKQKSGRRPFNDLFNDFWNSGRQAVYRQVVTESNELELKVLPLPQENRPADFSRLVGQYSLAAQAEPTVVNVGDPITLSIMVTGSEYLENVELPPLENLPELQNNFKVPEEMAPGKVDGSVKIFTQTIRAKYATVKEIPSISLNFFNPETSAYETAATKPIPLQVQATRIVTADDAEGAAAAATTTELSSLDQGIAHNYVGEDVLESQDPGAISWFGSPMALVLIFLPPTFYLLILVPVYMKRRHNRNGAAVMARKALPVLCRELQKLEHELDRQNLQQTVRGLMEAIKSYLGKRLDLPPGTLIDNEVEQHLKQYGVEDEILAELKDILVRCEAYHYGAVAEDDNTRKNIREMLHAARALFKKIEQCLQKDLVG